MSTDPSELAATADTGTSTGGGEQLLASLLGVLANLSSPDSAEAQQILLRRLALEGDVVGSRLPAPLNVTEMGGYINLLGVLQQPEMRAQALAGVLGVAGPNPPLGWLTASQPLALVALPNDRPDGPAQATLPLTFAVRSDFSSAFQTAVSFLHQRGCSLPVMGPTLVTLPPAQPGAPAPADVLPFLGRTLDLAATAALVDPETDPLALVRTQGSSDPFAIAANASSGTGTVTVDPGTYEGLECDATSCTPVALTNQLYVYVGPVLAAAGFYPASPLPQPTSVTSSDWAHFTNVTGLRAGVTALGDELSLLYSPSVVAGSAFGSMLGWLWNGSAFVAP
jgi:hypothetical protein